ncbi:14938_t:CDS:2 [Funneliformis geosporum]|nr:14938_t:CDS:2 [Funneliformis geosporum]
MATYFIQHANCMERKADAVSESGGTVIRLSFSHIGTKKRNEIPYEIWEIAINNKDTLLIIKKVKAFVREF